MAAQFGQNLIEEKEELEKQIECMKREHQNQLEVLNYIFYQIRLLNSSLFSNSSTLSRRSFSSFHPSFATKRDRHARSSNMII